MKNSNLIIIDDDDNDLDLLIDTFKEMNVQNEIIRFNDAHEFIELIKTTDKKYLFILWDINMNSLNGIELKRIDVQGYFIKANRIDQLKKRLQTIIDYWNYSEHPNL